MLGQEKWRDFVTSSETNAVTFKTQAKEGTVSVEEWDQSVEDLSFVWIHIDRLIVPCKGTIWVDGPETMSIVLAWLCEMPSNSRQGQRLNSPLFSTPSIDGERTSYNFIYYISSETWSTAFIFHLLWQAFGCAHDFSMHVSQPSSKLKQ